ncbi:hypothetical protein HNR39_003735 [Glaciimonas immobilis]|uniref:Uncharacterized protein n=1 Tax=Glaciimonas immobilis TaxID=728004 RepID=A0A840RWA5_9BURK|nr:hypothetical protein [Glaciimonas immobilis]KAF3998260.1 hypothetical protein HAV38_08615 [Glaciimonas immobilis]MBB5201873.1 hypothetical protein [Glaciimonas immobilis]
MAIFLFVAPLSPATIATELTDAETFSFAVIGHPFRTGSDELALRTAIAQTDDENLAFVVANGIKSELEPCSDRLYQRRKALLNGAKNGLIVSPAGSDWVGCKNDVGRSTSFERLNRIRELFFADEFSLGDTRIPLNRQSTSPKFRAYVENARWEIGNIMFATLNLPGHNNHYNAEGGRNSEFEDRLIANKEWLQRIFVIAGQKKSDGIVLFCDGDPLAVQRRRVFDFNVKRDGFVEMRRAINALASTFPGKVLLIHGPPANTASAVTEVVWKKNVGDMEIASSWAKVTVDERTANYFFIDKQRN